MTLPSLSEHDRKVADTINKLLSRDEWYAVNELMNMIGGDPVDTMLAFRRFMKDHQVLRVRGPSGGILTALWRGDTGDPSTKRLLEEEAVDVWDLPFTLRKSFTAKYKKAHLRQRIVQRSWRLVKVAIIVDEALAKIGLDTEHPRPSEGFPFQCVWRTTEPSVAGKNFSVGVTFTGTIRTNDFKLYRRIYDDHQTPIAFPGHRTELTVRRNFTTLNALVGRASVDRYDRHLSYCPTRSELMDKTRTILTEHASCREIATPFTPILCGFSLLSGNGHGRGE